MYLACSYVEIYMFIDQIAVCVCVLLKYVGSNEQIKLTQTVLFFTVSHSSSLPTSSRSDAHSANLWFLFCSSIFPLNLLVSVPVLPIFGGIFTEDAAHKIHCALYSVCPDLCCRRRRLAHGPTRWITPHVAESLSPDTRCSNDIPQIHSAAHSKWCSGPVVT